MEIRETPKASRGSKRAIWVRPFYRRRSDRRSRPCFTADIVTELATSIKLHTSLKSRLGGVHLEMTGDVDDSGFSVTECIGGSMNLASSDLGLRYQVRLPSLKEGRHFAHSVCGRLTATLG